MKIGIDASRYVKDGATGVEWYSKYIIDALLENCGSSEDDFVLYSRNKLELKGAKNKVIEAKRFWTLRKLSKEMKKNAPDALFVPSHTLPLTLPNKAVITVHDVAFRYLRSAYSFIQYHYLNWSTKFAVRKADKIIVPSEATAKDLVKLFKCKKEKIEVVMHGFVPPDVDDKKVEEAFETSEAFKMLGVNKKSKYIFFVGRLETKKNLARLIEAFKKLTVDFPEHWLVLAGKRGVGFDEILKTVKKLDLQEKVVMPGYIDEEEKVALYKHCEMFAFPSLYEGFGLPILESFHYKKPVLSSNSSSLPEVGGDAVEYCDPKEVDDIYQGMKKILENKEYADKLVEKGSERLKEFSWEKAAKKTFSVIKNA